MEVVKVVARQTEQGVEEITRDIPNVSEKKLAHLDERGIAKIGSVLGPNDIVVGKVTPKPIIPDRYVDPTEKILESLFGKAALRVKDTSYRIPSNVDWHARVVDVKVLTSMEDPFMSPEEDMIVKVTLVKLRKIEPGDKMSGRHGNKGVVSRIVPVEDMPYLDDGRPVDVLLNPLGVPARMNLGQLLEVHLGWAMKELHIRAEIPVFDSSTVHDVHAELARAWMFDTAWEDMLNDAWKDALEKNKKENNPFSLESGFFIRGTVMEASANTGKFIPKTEREIICEYIARKCRKNANSIQQMNEREIKELVCRKWLEKYNYNYDSLFTWEDVPENSPDALQIDIDAICASVMIWFERTKGIAPKEYDNFLQTHNLSAMNEDDLLLAAGEWEKIVQMPVPCFGKQWLRDGRTGKRFGRPVTVGVMNMIKLHHLVEDKINARSIGTYSSITQQPLGGKAKHGGQRIGEMEVWALQAYGCAYLLQEMLTIKSDDEKGRAEAWTAFTHGKDVVFTGIPGSFRVMVHELMGLGLATYLKIDDGKVLTFGRSDFVTDDFSGKPGDYLSLVAKHVLADLDDQKYL